MKKIFMALMLCFVSIVGFGQISVKSNTYGSTRIDDNKCLYSGIYGKIRQIDTVYYICVNDLKSDNILYVKLGVTKEEVINGLTTLDNIFDNLYNKEYVSFNDGLQDMILYKWGGVPYFSNGTAEYVHQFLKRSTLSGLFGGRGSISREGDKMIGCLDTASSFKKAINALENE